MVQKVVKYSRAFIFTAGLFASLATAVFAQDDPPTRVARLNYISGNVSMEPAGVDQWAPAVINRPFTLGDYLYADQSSIAELHMDNAVIRAGQLTNFGFLNLTDQAVQLKVTEGDMNFRIHDLDPNSSFEVDTPNAAITLLRNGTYRIHVDPNANTTFVFANTGQAEITGGGQAFTLNPGNSASLSGTDQLAFDIEGPPAPDAFDNWCAQRDAREAQMRSMRYLPPTVVGAEDLDDYGSWNQESNYGAVWYPRSVPAGWAPYHSGHWAWIEPWGWTWVDDSPWGYAPFHYGRWVFWHERWGWAPGPCARMDGYVGYGGPIIRPVYAPALVAFFGGAHFGVSISIGGGGGGASMGWVPLGWGEVYTPSYHCSPGYFNNVNVNNTRIVNTTNITNVYNTVYVNKTVYNQTFVNVRSPNAVSAMPQTAFASGRPVGQAGATVSQAQLAHFQPAQAMVVAPPVAPTREAVAPTSGHPAAAPPAQLAQRQVIARNTPPAQPASFASRQSYLQQHVGQPTDFAAMRRATAPQTRPAPAVHQVAAAKPVAVHQGQRVGNVPARQATATPATTRQATPTPASARQAEPSTAAKQPDAHGAPTNSQQGSRPLEKGRPASSTENPRQQGRPAVQETEHTRPTPQQQPKPAAAQPKTTEAQRNEAARPAAQPARAAEQHPASAEHGVPPHPAAEKKPVEHPQNSTHEGHATSSKKEPTKKDTTKTEK